ncbi:MAG: YbaK/EbsC family protein [Candidatus Nanoarchaeia archaeon]|nr:YbaK/EbsC family protein [Candidatus Nanoarchaeia archaeon]
MNVFKDIVDLLEKRGFEFEVLEHGPAYTSEDASKIRGSSLKMGTKAMVLKIKDGFIMAILSAEKKISSKKLRGLTGSRELRFATPEEVEKITHCKIGSVPPFPILFDLDYYLDGSVMENEEIVFSAGSHVKSIKMKAEDFNKIMKKKSADFSE